MSTIGLRVRLERDRLGISLDELAARCGVSPALQQDIESDRLLPEADYLRQADEAGLDVLFILTGQRRQPIAAEQQFVADYRAADEKGRSALEAQAGAADAQPLARGETHAATLVLVAALALLAALVVALRNWADGIDDRPPARAAAPPGAAASAVRP